MRGGEAVKKRLEVLAEIPAFFAILGSILIAILVP